MAALGFAPAGTAAGRGRSRSVESARGVAGQRLRCSRGFKAETIIFLMKAVAMLWLNLRERELLELLGASPDYLKLFKTSFALLYCGFRTLGRGVRAP